MNMAFLPSASRFPAAGQSTTEVRHNTRYILLVDGLKLCDGKLGYFVYLSSHFGRFEDGQKKEYKFEAFKI